MTEVNYLNSVIIFKTKTPQQDTSNPQKLVCRFFKAIALFCHCQQVSVSGKRVPVKIFYCPVALPDFFVEKRPMVKKVSFSVAIDVQKSRNLLGDVFINIRENKKNSWSVFYVCNFCVLCLNSVIVSCLAAGKVQEDLVQELYS